MNRRVSVRGVVFADGKLLCVKLKPYRPRIAAMNGAWCTPGGGLDENEPLLKGLEREMIEETAIAPVIGNLLYIQQFKDSQEEFLEFFFHIINAEDYRTIKLSETTHGEDEIEAIDFVDPATVPILPAFLTSESITAQIASQGPPQLISYL